MTQHSQRHWDGAHGHGQAAGGAGGHEPSIDVMTLLKTFWRRKWLLVFTAILGVAGGFLYVSRQKPVFESTCQLLVVKKHSGMESESVGSLAEYQNQLTADHLATEMDTIKSKRIVDRAIEIGQLHELESLQELVTEALPLNKAIMQKLRTTRGGKDSQTKNSNTINVAFQCYDPQDCAEVLAAVVAAYQEFLESSSKDVGKEVVDLFKNAESTLQTQFKEKQLAYHKFLSERKLLRNPETDAIVNVHTNRILELEAAKSRVQVDVTDVKSSLERIREAIANKTPPEVIIHNIQHNETASQGVTGPSVESGLQSQLNDLRIEERSLLEKMGEGHPKVASLRNQIKEIRRQLMGGKEGVDLGEPQDFITTYIASLEHRLKEYQDREAGYQNRIDEEMVEAKRVLEDELKDRAMRDDVENTRLLGDAAVKRLQEINLIKDFGSYNVQILSEPELGIVVGPRVALILAGAAVLGSFFGFGLIYLVENSDLSFHSAQDVSTSLGTPVLGRVPTAFADEMDTSRPGSRMDSSLAVFHRPKSKLAESFRAVRTALFFNSNASNCRVIQFTSADPGDGKSTISTNVAASIAQSGKRVVIVDADFRRPRIHSIFGLEKGAVGITSVIVGDAELDDAIQPTEMENLFCLPCGIRPPNPSELLTSPRFKELLEVLRERFDFVIVDTPPLLVVSDPSVVAAYVDTTVLAVRLKKNGRPGALRSAEILHSMGANLLGVVVNGVTESASYGYGYSYGGEYSYNDDVYYEDEEESEVFIQVEPRKGSRSRRSVT